MTRAALTGAPIRGLAAISLIVALAGCGKQEAELERPQPHRHESPAERAADAAQQRQGADAATNATEAGKPIQQQNPAIAPYTDPGPIQDQPIPGERGNPSGTPNPGQ
jgi:hypothetical protein